MREVHAPRPDRRARPRRRPAASSSVAMELSSLPERDRARVRRDELGLVFQSDNLLPFLTAVENVRLQLALSGSPPVDDRSQELLERLGVGGCADKLPDQLSGGQRQRVGRRPSAGPPAPGGPRRRADRLAGRRRARPSSWTCCWPSNSEAGSTLVVVTHDPAVARRLGRTIRIHDGRPAADPPMTRHRCWKACGARCCGYVWRDLVRNPRRTLASLAGVASAWACSPASSSSSTAPAPR